MLRVIDTRLNKSHLVANIKYHIQLKFSGNTTNLAVKLIYVTLSDDGDVPTSACVPIIYMILLEHECSDRR